MVARAETPRSQRRRGSAAGNRACRGEFYRGNGAVVTPSAVGRADVTVGK